ncbi:MAG: hypothetical protein HY052_02150 [Proteobacteria bacterium]|nr:hypothetical protein [Pseudomonadota bacterium]
MSKAQAAAKSSGGGLSLAFVVGSIVAWCKTPSFVGLAGVGKSLLTGLGTSIGSSIGILAGGLGGGLGLGLLGFLVGGKKGAIVGAIGGAIIGGVGGYGVGVYEGYTTVRGWLMDKDKDAVVTSFNDSAAKDAKKMVIVNANAFAKPAQQLHSA